MITQEAFYRTYVVRPAVQYQNAPLHNLQQVALPKMALLHYVTDTPAIFGIRGSNLVINGWNDDIRVSFILDGYGELGPRKNVVFSVDKAIRNFKATQKRFRVQPDWVRAQEAKQALCVFDYSALPYQYSYPQYPAMHYNAWHNLTQAMMDKIGRVVPERVQLIQIPMPTTWPSRNNFAMVEDKMSNMEYARWSEPGHFWLREIWRAMAGKSELVKWLRGDETNDKVKTLRDLCFVFTLNNQCLIISGNDLLERAAGNLNETRTSFYKALTGLMETATSVDTTVSMDARADETNQIPSNATSEDDTSDFGIVKEPEPFTPEKEMIPGVPNSTTKRISMLGAAGRLSAAEQNRLVAIAQNTDSITNPFKDGPLAGASTLGEMRNIDPAELLIDDDLKTTANKGTVPKHALKSATTAMTTDYISRGLLQKDIVNMLSMAANSGVLIQDITVEPLIDAVNDAQTIRVQVVPIDGKVSTWPIEIPVIHPDGTFTADGTKYSLDFQKIDLPIRKVSPTRAALTSYMGKLFIQRSPIVKNNYTLWLTKSIGAAALDANDDRIINQQFGENTLPMLDLPREYTALMRNMTRFESNGYIFYFAYDKRELFFGADVVKRNEVNGRLMIGKSADPEKQESLSIDMAGNIYSDGNFKGHFLEVVGRNWGSPPRDVAEILVFGKRVPVILVLAYYTGLEKLLRHLNARYRTVASNVRLGAAGLSPFDIPVRFKDVTLIVDARDPVVSMLASGLNNVESAIKAYNFGDFNKVDVYGPIFKQLGAARHHITELDLISELFIDPITLEILKDMGEPTDLISLMIKAVWLVRNDNYTEETDPRMQRRRGYERVAGFVYSRMVKSIREQRNKPNPSNHPVHMGPRDVWADLVADPTVQLVKELNPVHTLKEQEAVSLSGEGGRKAQTLVKRSRVFHPNDLGSISEATPDSGKVGIRTYMTANAKAKNLRGLFEPLDLERDGSTSCISSNALLLPCMMHDDG